MSRVSLDLFEFQPARAARCEQPPKVSPRLPRPEHLAELSDPEIGELTGLLVNELVRRTSNQGRSPHLTEAIEQLAALRSSSRSKGPLSVETSDIANGKRNAIRAALVAGVRPSQVARHFGVSLGEVRKVASQRES